MRAGQVDERRLGIETLSAWTAAMSSGVAAVSGRSRALTRVARCGGAQSSEMWCGKSGPTIRWLAVAMKPCSGLRARGISSKGTGPVHSYSPVQPGTGSQAFAAGRIGTWPRVR